MLIPFLVFSDLACHFEDNLLIFLIYETNLDDSADSSNSSVRGYLLLSWKDSVTDTLGLAVCVKEELLLHSSYLKKAPRILIYVFDWLQFIQFLPFFTLSFNNFVLFIVFNAIASNIDEFLSINPFANVFVFGDLNVHYKDWLTYCQTTLPGWLAFLLGSLSVNLSTLF